MTRLFTAALLAGILVVPGALSAQAPADQVPAAAPAPPQPETAQSPADAAPPEQPASPADPTVPSIEPDVERGRPSRRGGQPALRIGQDYTLDAGAVARDVVVIGADAIIDGRIDGSLTVILGNARLGDAASLEELVVVGGNASATTGTSIERDLVIVGGTLDAPAGFRPGGEHVVVGPAFLGGRLDPLVPWITRGVLWGRPFVPDLPWVWAVAGVFFLTYLLLGLIFEQPVRACATTLAGKPLTAFVVGLLVLLFVAPVCLLLTVSVVGVAVIPLVLCALIAAWIIGKIGVARWLGTRIVPQESEDSRLQSLRSFVIGFVVICLAYMMPVLGIIVWTMVGVFGIGAAALAFMHAYRRENPLPPPVPTAVSPPPTAPPSVSPFDASYAGPTAAGDTATVVPPITSPGIVPPPSVADLAAFPRATFRDRLAAFALDIILVVISGGFLDLNDDEGRVFLLVLVYHIGFWAWKGTTVGGIICQLRLTRVDGQPLRLVDAVVRGLSGIFSMVVLGIGFLWILKDPERQAWHDKIAGTYVVKVPRNWPL